MPEVPMEEIHEQIHHHAHDAKESWIGAVALCTALIATFAAVSALLSSKTGEESLKEHSASFDQWAFYQAKGIKGAVLQNKIDLTQLLGKTPDEKDAKNIERYKTEQEEIKTKAEALSARSEAHGKCQANFEFAVTMFQVAIAIAAISVLTKKKPFWFVSLLFAAVGIYFLITGYSAIPPHESSAHTESHEKTSAPAEKSH